MYFFGTQLKFSLFQFEAAGVQFSPLKKLCIERDGA